MSTRSAMLGSSSMTTMVPSASGMAKLGMTTHRSWGQVAGKVAVRSNRQGCRHPPAPPNRRRRRGRKRYRSRLLPVLPSSRRLGRIVLSTSIGRADRFGIDEGEHRGGRRDRVTLVDRARDATGPAAEHEIEVAVLGPVEVRGMPTRFTRSASLELVVYLALHPFGADNDAWATALWPDRVMAPATLHSTASAARRALGPAATGFDHLPRAHGRLRLGRSVTTDWRRFEVLAAAAD